MWSRPRIFAAPFCLPSRKGGSRSCPSRVRQYARLVGLDPEPLLEAFGRAIGPREVPVPTMLDEPLWQSARSGVRGLITALVVALRLPAAKVMAYTYLVPSWVILWEIVLHGAVPPGLVLVGVALTVLALGLLLKE